MNVAGYREALAAAHPVEVEPKHILRVSSIPGLASLKLLAWAERGLGNPKDVQDLLLLLKNYARAGNEARLYEEDQLSLLSEAGFDPDQAGATLLGQDCRRMLAASTLAAIMAILQDASKRDRLILHMHSGKPDHGEEAIVYLDRFQRGLVSSPKLR